MVMGKNKFNIQDNKFNPVIFAKKRKKCNNKAHWEFNIKIYHKVVSFQIGLVKSLDILVLNITVSLTLTNPENIGISIYLSD